MTTENNNQENIIEMETNGPLLVHGNLEVKYADFREEKK